jgi:RNA polymerase sigma-70 factor, ECF subfamily
VAQHLRYFTCAVSTRTEDIVRPNGIIIGDDWVDAHADYLFNFAFGQVRDVNIAEDLVQDVFLAAVKARDAFRGQSSVRTWLVGILRHKIYDHLRRSCRERTFRRDRLPSSEASDEWEEAVLWLHEAAAECQSPVRHMELSELREALSAAIDKLPPRLAQVFQLYEIEEKPNHQVCEEFNISQSNLWVMLHRARKQLKKELAGWRSCRRSSNK